MDVNSSDEGRIRFAPSILKRLGEELNPNVDQGLLELVKNAYDADATECHIWLESPLDDGSIVIEDDGDGMNAEDIRDGWLVLGGSSKKTDELTNRGRRPAGNKGLGRLAALRLGRIARMSSSPGSGGRYSVELNWDRFDEAETVDEIDVPITYEAIEAGGTGTRIELHDLRSAVGRVDARRLARALVLLADPFGDAKDSFRPYLHSDEFSDLARQVEERYFDQADFHLVGELRDGRALARVEDWRGDVLWRAEHEELSATAFGAPDAEFDLWVFILSSQVFSTRPVQLSAVREWLSHFGGVHIYVNGLRVAPYGNPGNDWLDLNLARVRSPEERPGTNTSIGRLRVEDARGALVQKTDRSGFIDSEEFAELRRFATSTLDWMARRRVEAAERKRQAARQETKSESSTTRASVETQISQVSDEKTKSELRQAFEKYDRARERETESLRREVQLYRTLSTAGITAATFAHESNGNPLKRITLSANSLKAVLEREDPTKFDARYRRPLENIRGAVDSLGVLSSATLDLISQDKRRIGKVLLDRAVRDICETFESFLQGRQVELELRTSPSGHPFIRGSAAAVESVVTNLINNSLTALERGSETPRLLRIETSHDGDSWDLQVDDNGPGIVGITLDEIWLPGHTVRPGGTGLGLTIVRDSVADLGGTVSAEAHGDLGGARFNVRLPILGVDDAE